jgi:uncharacterized protein YndB with AHSA1/START domain
MKKEINQKWFFEQSPKEVWEYLTRPELIEQWLTKTDFEPVTGQKFRFIHKSGKIVHCQVLEIKPFTRLSYSWQFPSAVDKKPVDSKIEWTLIPKENGTELQLRHNGFTLPEDLNGHISGWNICMKLFGESLESH